MVSKAVQELQSAKNQRQENIRDLESQIAQIDASIAALSGLDGSAVAAPASAPATPTPVAGVKKGGMSAAHRQALAASQKARWAKFHAAKAATKTPAAVKPAKKKKMSPLGKLKIKLGSLNRYGKTAEAKQVKAQIAALEGK